MESESLWSKDIVNRLAELWDKGETTVATAAALSVEFGVTITKNAVVGKAHRIGLAGRPSPIKGERRPKPEPTKPAHTCRFILAGNPRTGRVTYCDKQTMTGKSYCPEHYARCVVPAA